MYTNYRDLVDITTYPSGESHQRLRRDLSFGSIKAAEVLVLEARVRDFADLAQVAVCDQVMRTNGMTPRWFLPYFPFARDDRRHDAGDGSELGLALELVRSLDIVIADPHSDVAGQLPHIAQADVVKTFRKAGAFDDDPVIIIPDAGATKKAYEWATEPTVQALKRRDPATGELSGFTVLVDDLDRRPCIIVDDICDGGGTFLGLAQILKEKNAGSLTLAITHGLFTKGTHALANTFERVMTFRYSDRTEGAVHSDGVDYLPFEDLFSEGTQR